MAYLSCHENRYLLDLPLVYNTVMTKFTEEHKKQISEALKGKPKPWQRKVRIAKLCPCGNTFYLTPGQVREGHGKYCSRKCSFKYQRRPKMIAMAKLCGENSINWKGDCAGYKAFHLRVQKTRGIASVCVDCGSTKKVEWANLTGNYADVMDYKELCKKCHNKFDSMRKSSTLGANGNNTREGGVVSA